MVDAEVVERSAGPGAAVGARAAVGRWSWREVLWPALMLIPLAAGGVAAAGGASVVASWLWGGATVAVLLPAAWTSLRSVLRGSLGVDLVAVLAMTGALVFGEYLAGAIIALMLTGGEALERYAVGRARRELTALLERAPQRAQRRTVDGYEEVPVEALVVGDEVLVRAGEVVPADGVVQPPAEAPATVGASNMVGRTGAAEAAAANPDAAAPDAVSPDAVSPDAVSPDAAAPDAVSPDAAAPGGPGTGAVVAAGTAGGAGPHPGAAVLDESALTGESRPVTRAAGEGVRSGATNAGPPFTIRLSATADQSTYAGIVRMVSESAREAPAIRLADRFAGWFLLLTVLVAGLAWWLSGDPVRALAVLVVATPCPLILAVPVAIVAGVSRAARRGVIIKGGAPLEQLARARVVLLDKTGTITTARSVVTSVEMFADIGVDDVVRLAASLEQVSTHPFAHPIVAAARARGLALSEPRAVAEHAGLGMEGVVDGRRVAVGQLAWVRNGMAGGPPERLRLRMRLDGASGAWVAVDGVLVGALVLRDAVRPEAPRALRAMRGLGVERIWMVTGDHRDTAAIVGDAVGVDRVLAERSPAEKVEVVREARSLGVTVMVGDGVNDAPALALADVGVAMGAHGAGAAADAADLVLTVDRLDGLVTALRVGRRTRLIALQSVLVGLGLSVVAMVVAALGYLPPVAGALLQEGIDLVVIVNALRALGEPLGRVRAPAGGPALAERLLGEHAALDAHVDRLAEIADRLGSRPGAVMMNELREIVAALEHEVVPHELAEQRDAFPIVAALVPGEDPTAALVTTHAEIVRRVRGLSALVGALPDDGPDLAEQAELRRLLYGLQAVLRLHFAQEEELYDLLHAGG